MFFQETILPYILNNKVKIFTRSLLDILTNDVAY